MHPDSFGSHSQIAAGGTSYDFFRLSALTDAGIGHVGQLPFSLKILLENLLRHEDGRAVDEDDVRALAAWVPNSGDDREIAFTPARVLLQDFTGVPVVVDLASMRDAIVKLGGDPKKINPLQPVDLVIDHSVQVDSFGLADSFQRNVAIEFGRNAERYKFLRWGQQAFDNFRVVPPGTGIVHQVNLEYLASVVFRKPGDGAPLVYPDTVLGTDSHTTMINGLGVLGWGVGGIEAEAAMLGQPVSMLIPEVLGFKLTGRLPEGTTATDLVLRVTQMLRARGVVGKFVEFYGAGLSNLPLASRATIANMAPEYGATMGFFPVDDATVDYLRATGRTELELDAFTAYFKAQGMYGIPRAGDLDYTKTVTLDLASIKPSLAGPKRPQDRIEMGALKSTFTNLFSQPIAANGFAQAADKLARRYSTRPGSGGAAIPNAPPPPPLPANGQPRNVVEMVDNHPTPDHIAPASTAHPDIGNGDVLIAAITSCTNTSNPGVLLAAGLLAKKAVEKGLTVQPHIKTSLAPGSRVVTDYLTRAGLLPYLEQLGFGVTAYGCTTCIGNAGDLTQEINEAISANDLVCAAVLSGNRNFEARIHPNLKANFLASPPLVVAYAIAGTVIKDLSTEPVGIGKDGPVYLKDIWPTSHEIAAVMGFAKDPESYRKLYGDVANANPLWGTITGVTGQVYNWPASTYIAKPPFFDTFKMQIGSIGDIRKARVLGIFGDSVTTDHISPAGSIKPMSPAGVFLMENDVSKIDFNSYGSRRGNHEIMMRGTFANVRIKNLMIPLRDDGTREEGGVTLFQPGGDKMFIYDAAMKYVAEGTPTVIFGGEEYGTGSSRDWAAKGTQLLGVKAVIAKSFERIHRNNLVGMGVLPCQFLGTDTAQSLGLKGDEEIDITGISSDIRPQQQLTLVIRRKDGTTKEVKVLLRIDTPIEVDYYKHGGILPFVLRELLAA